MRAQRQNQNYQLLLSEDGKRWQLIKEYTPPIDVGNPILAGLDGSTASGGNFLPGTATFDNVSVSADVVQPSLNGPVGLQAEPGSGKVLLTFLPVANATGYNIYRRQVGQTPDQSVRANAVPTSYAWFVDDTAGSGLPNGAPLIYIVRAVIGAGDKAIESLDSTPVLSEPQVPIAPGFRSTDGTNFTQIGQAVTLPGLSVNQFTYAGLAVTAHKDGLYGTGKFDAASVTLLLGAGEMGVGRQRLNAEVLDGAAHCEMVQILELSSS
jgi:hypothetical protein